MSSSENKCPKCKENYTIYNDPEKWCNSCENNVRNFFCKGCGDWVGEEWKYDYYPGSFKQNACICSKRLCDECTYCIKCGLKVKNDSLQKELERVKVELNVALVELERTRKMLELK